MIGVLRDLRHALIMGIALPAMMLSMSAGLSEWSEKEMPEFRSAEGETMGVSVSKEAETRILLRDEKGNVAPMALEAYLVGAVLGDMPASFEEEALKAQSVAARTYALKNRQTGGKHGDGSVCVNAGCCQAYCDKSAYLRRGGTESGIEKVMMAVENTEGLVLTYDGALIDATYFACSGGRTENAAEVWGVDFPYLRATDSPGEEAAAYYQDSKWISFQDLQTVLKLGEEETAGEWIGEVTRTSGGGIATMEIRGRIFTGTELRRVLGLRSTFFSAEVSEGGIRFDTKGYGHRVGMSQYGANAMALAGSTYPEILEHYYPGTALQKYIEN